MDETIGNIRKTLIEGLEKPKRANSAIIAALKLVDKLDAEMSPLLRRRGRGATYLVQTVRRQEMLTESRSGQSNPYRVSLEDYLAIASVMQGLKSPFEFRDAFEQALKKVPELRDYEVWVCRRFWMREPALIERVRSRQYRLTSPENFLQEARRRWDAMTGTKKPAAGKHKDEMEERMRALEDEASPLPLSKKTDDVLN